MKLSRAFAMMMPALHLGSELVGKFPKRSDSWPERIAKGLSIADTVHRTLGGGRSKIRDIVTRDDLAELESEAFVKLFFNTTMSAGFKLHRTALDEKIDLIEATAPSGEKLLFKEGKWSGAHVEHVFWHTRDLKIDRVVDDLWGSYPDGIYVSRGASPSGYGQEMTVCSVPIVPMRYFSKSAHARLTETTGYHAGYMRAGVHRTYLLIGLPGRARPPSP